MQTPHLQWTLHCIVIGMTHPTPKPARVALVTGAAVGIGRAIAERLSRDGYFVLAHYHRSKKDAEKLVCELGADRVRTYAADLGSEAGVRKLIAALKRDVGHIDVVVNNAAWNQTQTVRKLSARDFDTMMAVNVRSAALVTHFALPLLEKSKDARIILMSSINAFKGSPDKVAYVVSKAALLGLTHALALELAPRILVNAIAPGSIDTAMFQKFKTEPTEERVKKIPLKRIGTPEDIAGVVSFLASPDSSYLTGECIHVNGGVYFK